VVGDRRRHVRRVLVPGPPVDGHRPRRAQPLPRDARGARTARPCPRRARAGRLDRRLGAIPIAARPGGRGRMRRLHAARRRRLGLGAVGTAPGRAAPGARSRRRSTAATGREAQPTRAGCGRGHGRRLRLLHPARQHRARSGSFPGRRNRCGAWP
jgi:hypothetical protein